MWLSPGRTTGQYLDPGTGQVIGNLLDFLPRGKGIAMVEEHNSDGVSARRDVAVVGLGVTGELVEPAALTQATALEPSRSWRKGEVYSSRSGQQIERFQGLWVVERRGAEVEEVATALLAAVEPSLAAVREAASQARAKITVSIWWEPAARQGGFSTSSDIMRRLAELGERIDVYFPG